MRSFIQNTDSIAVVGSGIALSVYKWLMHKGFTCIGSFGFYSQRSTNSGRLEGVDADRKEKLNISGVIAELDALPENVSIALIDMPLSYIAHEDFKTLIDRYENQNRGLKFIFFPRIKLPKRVGNNKVMQFISSVDNSLKNLDLTLKISHKNKKIAFFPVNQLFFYMGLRSQLETGKNHSLEFVQLAISLFRCLYLETREGANVAERISDGADIKESCDFLGDSHILNIIEAVNIPKDSRFLLMSGSEWDAQNFSYTPYSLRLGPKYSNSISKKISIEFPRQRGRILITNIGTQSHCIHDRLTEAMKINNIKESDLHYSDFVYSAIKYYRSKHLKLLSDIKGRYSAIIVISDPPFQHYRIYEDGRKYEKTYNLIDRIYQNLFEDIGCVFLNSRNIIGSSGRAFDFLSKKTISSTSDEIDWIHGNSDYYKFIWRKTLDLITKSMPELSLECIN